MTSENKKINVLHVRILFSLLPIGKYSKTLGVVGLLHHCNCSNPSCAKKCEAYQLLRIDRFFSALCMVTWPYV
jgi:hypothetical protein